MWSDLKSNLDKHKNQPTVLHAAYLLSHLIGMLLGAWLKGFLVAVLYGRIDSGLCSELGQHRVPVRGLSRRTEKVRKMRCYELTPAYDLEPL